VFRFNDGKYYVVRANALEDNFRLYYYDEAESVGDRARQGAGTRQWHTVRVVALGDHIQAWLDGKLYLITTTVATDRPCGPVDEG